MTDAIELGQDGLPDTFVDGAAATATTKHASGRLASGPFAALRLPPFRWWFISQITSASGLMTQMVATSWLVLKLTGSGLDLGLLSASALLPVLVLSLWAGSVVDHRDTRHVLIFTQSGLAVVSLLLFVLIESGGDTFVAILLLVAAGGVISSLDYPARQIYVQELVGREQLAGAIGLYEVILNLSRVLGPAIGGVLLAASGPAACVLVNAISFLAPLAVLIIFRPAAGEREPERHESRPKAIDGLRYAWGNPAMRACLMLAAASGVIFNLSVLLPLLSIRVFHMHAAGYGLLMAIFGLGALPGALLASHGGTPTGHRVRLLAAATGSCVLVIAVAPDRPLLYLAMAATGLCSIWMIAVANTLVQLRASEEIRGRVMGAWNVALPGTVPLTSITASAIADAISPRAGYGVTGIVIVGIALGCWRSFGRE